jgi:RNA polymerase sigma factor (sigma-70 family)
VAYPEPAPPDEQRRRFEVVYAAHHAPLLGYVLRRTGNGDDAADVFAETFLTAWRRLEEIPPGDEARLWLYGVARRVLANHRRGERRRSALADRLRADLATAPPHADPPRQATGELAEVSRAFRRLPEADQELLALSGWEGLDAGQIAITLGCSRNAARIRLHRARRRFAAELAAPAPADRGRETSSHLRATRGDLA